MVLSVTSTRVFPLRADSTSVLIGVVTVYVRVVVVADTVGGYLKTKLPISLIKFHDANQVIVPRSGKTNIELV
jgi:hypothetical protein